MVDDIITDNPFPYKGTHQASEPIEPYVQGVGRLYSRSYKYDFIIDLIEEICNVWVAFTTCRDMSLSGFPQVHSYAI
jgi:hypothetical protein